MQSDRGTDIREYGQSIFGRRWHLRIRMQLAFQ